MESPPLNGVSWQIFHVNGRECFQSRRALTSKNGRPQQDNLSSHTGSYWPGLCFQQWDTINKPQHSYPVRPHQNTHFVPLKHMCDSFSFSTVPLPALASCWYVETGLCDPQFCLQVSLTVFAQTLQNTRHECKFCVFSKAVEYGTRFTCQQVRKEISLQNIDCEIWNEEKDGE